LPPYEIQIPVTLVTVQRPSRNLVVVTGSTKSVVEVAAFNFALIVSDPPKRIDAVQHPPETRIPVEHSAQIFSERGHRDRFDADLQSVVLVVCGEAVQQIPRRISFALDLEKGVAGPDIALAQQVPEDRLADVILGNASEHLDHPIRCHGRTQFLKESVPRG
jgi:hypothetical protein